MKPLLFILLVSCIITKGFGQSLVDSMALQYATSQSKKIADAFTNKDYSLIAQHTYPKVVKMMGGTDHMIEAIKKSMADLEKQGIGFKNVHMGKAFSLVKTETTWQCLVPEHMTITSPQKEMKSTTYLIGISSDHGKTWTFVDTGKKDIAAMQKMLPEVSSKLELPAQQ